MMKLGEMIVAKQIKLNGDQVKALRNFLNKKKSSATELARAQAIFMYEKRVDAELIIEITGLKKSALFKWRSRFIREGIKALKDREKAKSNLATLLNWA